MKSGNLFVSELSTSKHTFQKYHFCRGNSNRRKTRIGVILKGDGAYIYLGRKLNVKTGDVVFIPENIYCYSEWRGEPDIEVVYLSCFIHYESFRYAPQIIAADETLGQDVLEIAGMLNRGQLEELEAYARFYKLLQKILPAMEESNIAMDKTLQQAVEYITSNWDKDFSVAHLAETCGVSESTLYHLFQKELGQTPVRYLNSIRINVAIEYLENSNDSVSGISQKVGFHSENHFRKVFTEFTGTTPLKFRKSR